MLRHLLRHFQRALLLQQAPGMGRLQSSRPPLLSAIQRRTLFQLDQINAKSAAVPAAAESALEEAGATAAISSERDAYIVPYRAELERQTPASVIIEALRTRFRLTSTELQHIMSEDVVQRKYRERSLLESLELLALEGVGRQSFIDYPWLITLDKGRLERKMDLMRTLPVRDINDFVPFLRLSVMRLNKLVRAMSRESDIVPYGNRVYFISEKLQTQAYVVTKYLAKRLFILEMPFEMLEQNLQHMIDYKVSPLNVLKDLWAFRYTPQSVRMRLERAKRAKKDKIMPWMVRCPEPILQRSLKRSIDEVAVLDGKSSAAEYVAERLEFSVEHTKAIMAKHPQVNTVRVKKIQEVLDYLLDEAGFTRYEIAQVPRILCHSLKTTKRRMEELKLHGCRPSSLVIVCRSKREYAKFLQAWIALRSKGYAASTTAQNEQQQQQSKDTAET